MGTVIPALILTKTLYVIRWGLLFYLQNVTVLHQATTRWCRGEGHEVPSPHHKQKGKKQLNFWPNPRPAQWIHTGRLLAFAGGTDPLLARAGAEDVLIVSLGLLALRTLGDRGPTLLPWQVVDVAKLMKAYISMIVKKRYSTSLREQPGQLQVKGAESTPNSKPARATLLLDPAGARLLSELRRPRLPSSPSSEEVS